MNLDYNLAWHMRCEMMLLSGRSVTLRLLDQVMTYDGLLEGTPNAETNDWYIAAALRAAKPHCIEGASPFLIPPSRRDYLRTPGDMDDLRKERPHRIPEWLPSVRCIGSFVSTMTVREPEKHGSTLVVVWFQDEYSPPFLEPAASALRQLDWETLAADFEY